MALLVIASSLHTRESPHYANYDVHGAPATLQTCMRSIRDSSLRLDEGHLRKNDLTATITESLVDFEVIPQGSDVCLTWEEIRSIALLSSANERLVLQNRISQYFTNAKITPLKDRKAPYAHKFLASLALLRLNPEVIANIVLYTELDPPNTVLPAREFARIVLLVAEDIKDEPYRTELPATTINKIQETLPLLTGKNEIITGEAINSVILTFKKHLYQSLLERYVYE